MTSLIRFDRVSFGYGRDEVLHDVSLEVHRGDFLGIVGPSGSGKTTALRLMLQTIAPSEGSVARHRGLRVGYVPQVESVDWQFPVSVREVVLMASPTQRRWPRATRGERCEVDGLLERLGIGEIADRHIRELSGGQQQRVFVARAMMTQPDLLLLDEPTSGVDVATRHDMLHLLADLNRQGVTIVVTTHDLNGVAAHLPQLVCLNGRVIASGRTREVLTSQVLEATYGAPMSVLEHAGFPVVVDDFTHGAHSVALRVPWSA